MLHTFYRQELFDLVWSEPTRTIAKRLGISDVGLAKACRRADLLLPPRGYWAKLAAGKTVKKPQLPRRGPGMSDRIVLGRDRWSWGPDPVDLSTPILRRRRSSKRLRNWQGVYASRSAPCVGHATLGARTRASRNYWMRTSIDERGRPSRGIRFLTTPCSKLASRNVAFGFLTAFCARLIG